MKWIVDDDGSYDRVIIREEVPRAARKLRKAMVSVLSPAEAFTVPTDADRQAMLATAEQICLWHNEKEPGHDLSKV